MTANDVGELVLDEKTAEVTVDFNPEKFYLDEITSVDIKYRASDSFPQKLAGDKIFYHIVCMGKFENVQDFVPLDPTTGFFVAGSLEEKTQKIKLKVGDFITTRVYTLFMHDNHLIKLLSFDVIRQQDDSYKIKESRPDLPGPY